jgi:hypothetical protein
MSKREGWLITSVKLAEQESVERNAKNYTRRHTANESFYVALYGNVYAGMSMQRAA